MKTKVCTKCGEGKKLTEFVKSKYGKLGVRGECKTCQKKYRDNNREKTKNYWRLYYLKNKIKIDKYNNEYVCMRRKTNIGFKLTKNLRDRIYIALKKNIKSKKTLELLGCSVEDLKKHLQEQFTDGMTWQNHGLHGWHIDHIKPCASFDLSKEEEQSKCFHYTNLQPLWAEDNWNKGSKI